MQHHPSLRCSPGYSLDVTALLPPDSWPAHHAGMAFAGERAARPPAPPPGAWLAAAATAPVAEWQPPGRAASEAFAAGPGANGTGPSAEVRAWASGAALPLPPAPVPRPASTPTSASNPAPASVTAIRPSHVSHGPCPRTHTRLYVPIEPLSSPHLSPGTWPRRCPWRFSTASPSWRRGAAMTRSWRSCCAPRRVRAGLRLRLQGPGCTRAGACVPHTATQPAPARPQPPSLATPVPR
jgi:hypothetical protein